MIEDLKSWKGIENGRPKNSLLNLKYLQKKVIKSL